MEATIEPSHPERKLFVTNFCEINTKMDTISYKNHLLSVEIIILVVGEDNLKMCCQTRNSAFKPDNDKERSFYRLTVLFD